MSTTNQDPSLIRMFFNRAEKYRMKTALRFKSQGKYNDVDYAEFALIVRCLAIALKKLGIGKGDRVAIVSENRPEWLYADLATLALGAVTVPIYPTGSAKECAFIVSHSETKILFVSTQELWMRLESDLKQCANLESIILFDEVSGLPEVKSFWGLIRDERSRYSKEKDPVDASVAQVKRDEIATIIYTSGTTGTPKGVMLTHENILSNCWATSRVVDISERDTALSVLPLSHIFERMAGFYLQIYQGSTIAFAENMKMVGENLLEVRPTVMNAVPRFFEKLYDQILLGIEERGAVVGALFRWAFQTGKKVSCLKQEGRSPSCFLRAAFLAVQCLVFSKIKKKLGGRIRFFISGGAPLSKEIAEFFHALDILVIEGYGLTETSPVISCNRESRYRFGSVGLPLENVQVKIAPDGEICVKGPSVMKGYYKNEEATRAVMSEGWFATGDIGRLDGDGFLYITDRKKDLIKTAAGKYVSPQQVENLLISDNWIQQAFVYGDKRKFIVALIVPEFQELEHCAREHGWSFTSRKDLTGLKEVKGLFGERVNTALKDLAEYEKVKYFALLPEEMSLEKGELTPTLKMKRRVVFEKYQSVIEKLYADAGRAVSP